MLESQRFLFLILIIDVYLQDLYLIFQICVHAHVGLYVLRNLFDCCFQVSVVNIMLFEFWPPLERLDFLKLNHVG